jgi:hypothetical protein
MEEEQRRFLLLALILKEEEEAKWASRESQQRWHLRKVVF